MPAPKRPYSCPSCTSEKISLFHDKVWTMPGSSAYRCNNCQAAFIYPMFTPEQEKIFIKITTNMLKIEGLPLHVTRKSFIEKVRLLPRND